MDGCVLNFGFRGLCRPLCQGQLDHPVLAYELAVPIPSLVVSPDKTHGGGVEGLISLGMFVQIRVMWVRAGRDYSIKACFAAATGSLRSLRGALNNR